ncbi:hypothetical protein [Prochlorococcus marinus]|uniref:hypothetical protein n=1 Tax=Prochlorococcus marinus TaxID=1219 RepID=UPI0022B3E5B8|nr:hypothetical protein [Prochlorococcus marinus]
MAKELTHRADELKLLGWSQHDILRYTELWDYRQRWGAINLEREDRQFLRKAESALPEIKSGKPSVKKPLSEKSYYCRIKFFLSEMNKAESLFDISEGSKGIWPVLLEEELRTLDYYEPVLGLPDTLKSKLLIPFREKLVSFLVEKYKEKVKIFDFDFNKALSAYNESEGKNWQPLRDGVLDAVSEYPVFEKDTVDACRKHIRNEVISMIKKSFPSLAKLDKEDPSDEWISESKS